MGLMRLLVGKCVVGIVGGTVLIATSTAAMTGVATYAAAKYYYSVKLGTYNWSNQLPFCVGGLRVGPSIDCLLGQ